MIVRLSVAAALLLAVGCSSATTSPTPTGSPAPSATSTTEPAEPAVTPPAEQPATLTAYTQAEVQALFDVRCLHCHDAQSSNIDLSAPFTETTVGVPAGGKSGMTVCGKSSAYKVRIQPGDREASLLWHKVKGTQDCGDAMPSDTARGGKKLDATELERLGLYIDALTK